MERAAEQDDGESSPSQSKHSFIKVALVVGPSGGRSFTALDRRDRCDLNHYRERANRASVIGLWSGQELRFVSGPNAFSESTVSTPNSVGENSVSSSQPIFCMKMRTHRVFLQNSPSLPQNSVSSLFQNSTLKTVLSKQYS